MAEADSTSICDCFNVQLCYQNNDNFAGSGVHGPCLVNTYPSTRLSSAVLLNVLWTLCVRHLGRAEPRGDAEPVAHRRAVGRRPVARPPRRRQLGPEL